MMHSSLLVLLISFYSSYAFAPTVRWTPVLRVSDSPCTRNRFINNNNKEYTSHPLNVLRWKSTLLSAESSPSVASPASLDSDPLLMKAALALRRTSWLSWWTQVILTTVSSVTLLFAKSVMDTRSLAQRTFLPGAFIFAGTGIVLSIFSILWTWGGRRMSRRILRRPKNSSTTTSENSSLQDSRIQVAQSLRKVIRVGTYLNLLGMLVTLIGAEQIIGLLAARVLTTASTANTMGVVVSSAAQVLQPLDILIVQANTNTLLSHFVSLVCTLYLTYSVHNLDPPSTEQDT